MKKSVKERSRRNRKNLTNSGRFTRRKKKKLRREYSVSLELDVTMRSPQTRVKRRGKKKGNKSSRFLK